MRPPTLRPLLILAVLAISLAMCVGQGLASAITG